jgi:hypothetical protein
MIGARCSHRVRQKQRQNSERHESTAIAANFPPHHCVLPRQHRLTKDPCRLGAGTAAFRATPAPLRPSALRATLDCSAGRPNTPRSVLARDCKAGCFLGAYFVLFLTAACLLRAWKWPQPAIPFAAPRSWPWTRRETWATPVFFAMRERSCLRPVGESSSTRGKCPGTGKRMRGRQRGFAIALEAALALLRLLVLPIRRLDLCGSPIRGGQPALLLPAAAQTGTETSHGTGLRPSSPKTWKLR